MTSTELLGSRDRLLHRGASLLMQFGAPAWSNPGIDDKTLSGGMRALVGSQVHLGVGDVFGLSCAQDRHAHASARPRTTPADVWHPDKFLSRWLGHSSIQTTLIYLEPVPDPLGSLERVP